MPKKKAARKSTSRTVYSSKRKRTANDDLKAARKKVEVEIGDLYVKILKTVKKPAKKKLAKKLQAKKSLLTRLSK